VLGKEHLLWNRQRAASKHDFGLSIPFGLGSLRDHLIFTIGCIFQPDVPTER
jgi:hypothetical protein